MNPSPSPENKEEVVPGRRLLRIFHRAASPDHPHFYPPAKYIFTVRFTDDSVERDQIEADLKLLLKFNEMREPFILVCDIEKVNLACSLLNLDLFRKYVGALDSTFCVKNVILMGDNAGIVRSIVSAILQRVIGEEKVVFK